VQPDDVAERRAGDGHHSPTRPVLSRRPTTVAIDPDNEKSPPATNTLASALALCSECVIDLP
jgi:hypothetical protein